MAMMVVMRVLMVFMMNANGFDLGAMLQVTCNERGDVRHLGGNNDDGSQQAVHCSLVELGYDHDDVHYDDARGGGHDGTMPVVIVMMIPVCDTFYSALSAATYITHYSTSIFLIINSSPVSTFS
ncbi:hypothetical protein [Photobacterium leiognathi]|uniref:hypothetical protein n=1 Tax=Photobacterium leiognathi TaxID=553611 RepID=UPI003AF38654